MIRLRLASSVLDQKGQPFGKPFDQLFTDRLRAADEFYQAVTPPSVSKDAASVLRQALAGMLCSKQFFFFDGDNWLDEHHSNPLHHGYRNARNSEWFDMLAGGVPCSTVEQIPRDIPQSARWRPRIP